MPALERCCETHDFHHGGIGCPLCEIETLRDALALIAQMPLDGDYDYAPGISERLIAEHALQKVVREEETS